MLRSQAALCASAGSLEMSVFQTLFAGNMGQLGAPGTVVPAGLAVRRPGPRPARGAAGAAGAAPTAGAERAADARRADTVPAAEAGEMTAPQTATAVNGAAAIATGRRTTREGADRPGGFTRPS